MKLKNKVRASLRRVLCGVQQVFLEEVLILGDSHAKVFRYPMLRFRLWQKYLNVVSVGAATASGLENPNSKTQAFQQFDRALGTTRAKKVVVMLGEVDTGFVIWYLRRQVRCAGRRRVDQDPDDVRAVSREDQGARSVAHLYQRAAPDDSRR